jgi:hypothetical protein
MEHNGQRIFRQQHTRIDRRIGRVAALAVAAAAVLGATAACTGSSGTPSSSGSTASAGSSLSPTPAGTQPGTSASTSSSGGGSGATTAPTSGAGNGATSGASNSAGSNATSGSVGNAQAGSASCGGSVISVSAGNGGAATGHHGLPLVFKNTGSRTCTLQGYPGAAIMNGSATVLNATRTLNGFIGDERQLSSAPLITLAPGASASAMLEWVVDNGEKCAPNGTGTLEVTPPNTTATTKLGSLTAGTQGVCADFEIHPLVSGTLTN